MEVHAAPMSRNTCVTELWGQKSLIHRRDVSRLKYVAVLSPTGDDQDCLRRSSSSSYLETDRVDKKIEFPEKNTFPVSNQNYRNL